MDCAKAEGFFAPLLAAALDALGDELDGDGGAETLVRRVWQSDFFKQRVRPQNAAQSLWKGKNGKQSQEFRWKEMDIELKIFAHFPAGNLATPPFNLAR